MSPVVKIPDSAVKAHLTAEKTLLLSLSKVLNMDSTSVSILVVVSLYWDWDTKQNARC